MAARKEMVRQQCTLKSTADLLALNFVFGKAFLEDHLSSEIANSLSVKGTYSPAFI